MKKELKTLLDAARAAVLSLAEAVQTHIDDLEEKQSERESEARQDKIDALSAILDYVENARSELSEAGAEIEGL